MRMQKLKRSGWDDLEHFKKGRLKRFFLDSHNSFIMQSLTFLALFS